MAAMQTPALFEAVPAIVVVDPLAETLGAAEGGVIEYHYRDAVKLAGHSCPTVAGAWLMTRAALARLYPNGAPQRGGMRVEMRQAVDEGVAGVIAGVVGLITGAANEGGFKGLAGRFGRQGLFALRRAHGGRDPLHAAGHRSVGRSRAPAAGGAPAGWAGGPDARRPDAVIR
jgi:hypothetical protein